MLYQFEIKDNLNSMWGKAKNCDCVKKCGILTRERGRYLNAKNNVYDKKGQKMEIYKNLK